MWQSGSTRRKETQMGLAVVELKGFTGEATLVLVSVAGAEGRGRGGGEGGGGREGGGAGRE